MTLSEVKNTLHGISSTLAFVEEKINAFKAWQQKLSKMKHTEKKEFKIMNKDK